MSSPISAVTAIPLPEVPSAAGSASAGGGEFQAIFRRAINGVERLGSDASQAAERFLTGEGGEVHTVALATQRAELALETFVQIRNKVVSAYQSVMQMQI